MNENIFSFQKPKFWRSVPQTRDSCRSQQVQFYTHCLNSSKKNYLELNIVAAPCQTASWSLLLDIIVPEKKKKKKVVFTVKNLQE